MEIQSLTLAVGLQLLPGAQGWGAGGSGGGGVSSSVDEPPDVLWDSPSPQETTFNCRAFSPKEKQY